ncbi:hypothetical protein [Streptomyces sp. SID13726]|uniref:hypothetical protein n=1 Tax=Streptomyces sp. SID13726 TaxID=2706058 RepID=UPI001EF1CA57|nr:hypothetical protein [Streptomyces sp. SID13726]
MHSSVTTTRAPLPVPRAAVFAVVGTVLGVSAHHLLAEGPVPWRQGAAAAAVLFAVGLVGAQRPRSLAAVVACSVAGQSGLHLWLSLTAHTPALHRHGGQPHGAHLAWHERLHGSLAMTAAHAVAATLVAVLLHRADAACWTVARGVTAALDAVRARLAAARLLFARPTAPARTASVTAVPVYDERPLTARPLLAHAVVRRGPPAAGTALAH